LDKKKQREQACPVSFVILKLNITKFLSGCTIAGLEHPA
jgi:hypothetical protein